MMGRAHFRRRTSSSSRTFSEKNVKFFPKSARAKARSEVLAQKARGAIKKLLEEDHADIDRNTHLLQDSLTNLCYEGKAAFGKNLKELQHILEFFDDEAARHVQFEENVLFPFLKVHIPKLESLLNILSSEHESFKHHLSDFKFYLASISKMESRPERSKMIEKIRETGTYLIFLLRNHIQTEEKSVYEVLVRELRPLEGKEIEDLAKQCAAILGNGKH